MLIVLDGVDGPAPLPTVFCGRLRALVYFLLHRVVLARDAFRLRRLERVVAIPFADA